MNELQLNSQMDIVGGAVGTWIVCIVVGAAWFIKCSILEVDVFQFQDLFLLNGDKHYEGTKSTFNIL